MGKGRWNGKKAPGFTIFPGLSQALRRKKWPQLLPSNLVFLFHTLNLVTGELLAIDVALTQLIYLSNLDRLQMHEIITPLTNSQAALNALSYPTLHSGQLLIKSISLKIRALLSLDICCTMRWSPGHSTIFGNMEANTLEQMAALPSYLQEPDFAIFNCQNKCT